MSEFKDIGPFFYVLHRYILFSESKGRIREAFLIDRDRLKRNITAERRIPPWLSRTDYVTDGKHVKVEDFNRMYNNTRDLESVHGWLQ